MLSVYSLTFFVANFIIVPYTCSLSDSNMACPGFSVMFRFLFDEDVVYEHVLEGHVYRRSTVTKATECHGLCRDDCRCVSMNYITNSEYDNCELNEANRHLEPTSLRPKTGARYYELVRQYMVEVCYLHSIFKPAIQVFLRKSQNVLSPGKTDSKVDASWQNQNLRTTCEGWPNGFASPLSSSSKSQKVYDSQSTQALLSCK